MSQAPVPSGVDGSGNLFFTGQLLDAEAIRRNFNGAIVVVNGGITDANIKDTGGGYDGIAESKFTFADHGSNTGHNHDGSDSAPLDTRSVRRPGMGDTEPFLSGPYNASLYPAEDDRLWLAAGKFILPVTKPLATGAFFAFPTVSVRINPTKIRNSNNTSDYRVLVSYWFIKSGTEDVYSLDKTAEVADVDSADLGDGYPYFVTRINIADPEFDDESGFIGMNWILVSRGRFLNPVT